MRYIDDDLNGKRILITGGAGFIGSNLAFYFQNHHPKAEVIVFDSFRTGEVFGNGNLKSFGHFKNLIGFKGEIISGDITSKSDMKKLKKFKFDYIFHQAAISDTTVTNQQIMIKTNVDAYKTILNLAIKNGANLIYASSGATYGDAISPQKVGREEPNNVYGFSKLMMDNLTFKKMQNLKISVVGLRYFNVYGGREFHKNKTSSMVLQFGHQILAGKNPKLFESSDKILRDFIYIEDVILANVNAMHPNKSGVYNVGTAKPRSFQEIVDILQKELKTDLKCEYIKNPFIGSYQFYTKADIRNTKKQLNFKPRFSLEDGIRDYIGEIKKIYRDFK